MRHAISFGSSAAAERRQASDFWADLLGNAAPNASETGEDSPRPTFPPRYADVTGTEFIKTISGDREPADWQAREDAMVAQLLAGNMPEWLQRWVSVRISKPDATPVVKVRVLPDYLCVGNDTDYRHLPLDPQSAQRVADSFGALLPTAKICHRIWVRSWTRKVPAIQLPTLRKKVGRYFDQNSTTAFDAHSVAIQEEMKRQGISPGEVVVGHKKDVVLAVGAERHPNKISFHGFYLGKYPAEPCYDAGNQPGPSCDPERPITTHPEGLGHFSDYSQGVRLLHPKMKIDGKTYLVADVLKDTTLCTLIAEGPIDPPRVPPMPPRKPRKQK